MKTKAGLPTELLRDKDVSAFLEAWFEITHLKQLYRQGWLGRGVGAERCESVADHSFAVALLVLLLAEASFPGLDREKLLRLALLHDLDEIHAGDLTPADGVTAREKSERERRSVVRTLGKLPGGAGYVELWEEYERQTTPEARLVRQVDRLEMALQAARRITVPLHSAGSGIRDLQGVLDVGEGTVEDPEMTVGVTTIQDLHDQLDVTPC